MSKRAVRKKSDARDIEPILKPVDDRHVAAARSDGHAPSLSAQWNRQFIAPAWAAVLSLAAGVLATGLGDVTLPFEQAHDCNSTAAMTKTLAQHGWLWENPQLGLPGVLDFRVIPNSDTAHLLILKLLSALGMAPFTAMNIYFFATFGLIGAAATWVLQRTGLRGPPAVLGGLLYALLPYHGWRNVQHLYLTAYYTVPIFTYLLLGSLRLLDKGDTPKWRTALILSVVLTAFGGYYAFFYAYLLGFAVLLRAVTQRDRAPLYRGGALCVATGIGIVLNVSPSIWYRLQQADPGSMIRPLQDTEIYGLKFVQMLLPLVQHRAPWLAGIASHYDRQAPMVNENQAASFGLIVGALLIVVIASTSLAMWQGKAADRIMEDRVRKLGLIGAWAFLFGTVGGASSLMGFYVTPFIRSANRISIFIAFFVLVSAGWLWQAVRTSWVNTDARRALFGVLGILSALVAVWDTADTNFFPRRAQSGEAFRQDAAFFRTLQQQVGAEARVFQVPFVRYPEGGLGAQDYYHLRPYLHTEGWRWSFGAGTGSQAETWNMQTASMVERDPRGFAQRLRQAGFTGVLLARSIPSRAAGFSESGLVTALGPPAAESPNREFAFFRVTDAQ